MGRGRRWRPHLVFGLVVAGFTGGVALWLRGLEWSWLLAYLAAINATTLGAYGYDKIAAKLVGCPRVPERVLHAAAFAGGTPGAALAQRCFRHKTAKASFQVVFWTLAIAQLALAIWLVARELTK